MEKSLSRTRIAGWALLALLALTVMSNLGATLSDMHLPGRASGGVTSIAAPFASQQEAEQLVTSWSDWQADLGEERTEVTSPPGTIVNAWLLIDSLVLAPALAMVLQLFARRRSELLDDSSWLKPVLRLCVVSALLYLLFDEAENVATAIFVYEDIWLQVGLLAAAKLLFASVTVLPILLSFIPRIRRSALPATPPIFATVRTLRMPLVAVVVVAIVFTQLPASVRPQVHDVVQSWARGDRPWTGVLAVLALVALLLMLWSAVSLLRRRAAVATESTAFSRDRLLAYVGGGVALVVVSLTVLAWAGIGRAAGIVAGGGLVAYGALSVPTSVRPGTARSATPWNVNVGRAVVAAPAFAFVLLVLGAANLAGGAEPKITAIVLALLGLGLSAGGWIVAGVQPPAAAAWAAAAITTAAASAVAIAAVLAPLGTGHVLGSVAMVLAFSMLLAAVLGALEWWLWWDPPRGALARIGFTRAPILIAFVALLALVSVVDSSVEFHAARTLTESDTEGPNHGNATDLDVDSLLDRYSDTTAPTDDGVLPVFILSVEGGGGRAAYWTLNTMNCVFGGAAPGSEDAAAYPACTSGVANWDDVFAASGISGGSVGLAMYAASVGLEGGDATASGVVDTREMFDTGFLDPTFANFFFVDAPNALFRVGNWRDRAETLELAFEDAVPTMDEGFFATQLEEVADGGYAPRFPMLMLNSAAVEDGCRINVSVARLADQSPSVDAGFEKPEPVDRSCTSLAGSEGPPEESATTSSTVEPPAERNGDVPLEGALAGTRDVADYVCHDDGVDLRISTAALLSARFPLISPTGALRACTDFRGDDLYTFAVDGGYVDSSGASPVVELVDRLIAESNANPDAPCLQPVVLQVDNGYAAESQPSAPGRPQELIAPITGSFAAKNTNPARQALANLVTGHRCPVADDVPDDHPLRSIPTYMHLYPRAHPGSEAPLGWSLSKAARHDLDEQLGLDANQCALLNTKAWLLQSTADLPSCAAVIPSAVQPGPDGATVCRIVRTRVSAETTEGPVECARRTTNAVPPRPSLNYNLCEGSVDDCPTSAEEKCEAPLAGRLPCRVTADTRGVVRIVLDETPDQGGAVDLVLKSTEPFAPSEGLPNSSIALWVALFFATGLIALVGLLVAFHALGIRIPLAGKDPGASTGSPGPAPG